MQNDRGQEWFEKKRQRERNNRKFERQWGIKSDNIVQLRRVLRTMEGEVDKGKDTGDYDERYKE